MVTMPVPRLISQDFWYCANTPPDNAVIALATQRPTVIVKDGLMLEAFTMSALSPVARMERPNLVFKNAYNFSMYKKCDEGFITKQLSYVLYQLVATTNGIFCHGKYGIAVKQVHLGSKSHDCNINGIESRIYNDSCQN